MPQHPSMASTPLDFSDDNKKLDFDSVRALVTILNQQMNQILENRAAQKALKHKCTSKLKIQSQEFFEFSEHSIFSNLYWGIESIEAALAEAESRGNKLEDSEKKLQVPASLDENGVTLGIPNSYLICCSYFYLSIVEFLRKNEWQMAAHFLQAILISPRVVYTEFVPGIFQSLIPLFIKHKVGKLLRRNSDFDDDMVYEVMKWMARRYKPWLMYYQIMRNEGDGICLADDQKEKIVNKFQKSKSMESQYSTENTNGLKPYQYELRQNEKMHSPTSIRLIEKSSNTRCLKDILSESDPDTPTYSDNTSSVGEIFSQNHAEDRQAEVFDQYCSLSWYLQAPSSKSKPERTSSVELKKEVDKIKITSCISHSFSTSLSLMKTEQYAPFDDYTDEEESILSISSKKHHFSNSKSFPRIKKSSYLQPDENFSVEQNGVLQQIISNLCFTEAGNEDYNIEMKTLYEILNCKSGLKYSLLKDVILDQLLIAISTSKEEKVVRTSVSILSTIVIENRSVIDDIKRKGLQLYDLATALKHNVHEAVILIYLINPSPAEIRTLELLPCLVEVVCASKSYKVEFTSFLLTPPAASLMIIEVLVTAFDYETNCMHLAAISSPRVLSGLLQVPREDNLDEFISLAAILVKCMRFDGKCRKYISEFSPVGPFVLLLWSNQKRATHVALEFFNELLRMPRSSAIGLLEQMQKQGSMNNMCALFLLTQNCEPEQRLLAANLLLQLEVLEDKSAKCIYKEEAARALVESLTREESPTTQALSAFILSNLGGTCSWTGEPYTMAWLVKKTGLTLANHRNLIKNYDFLDQSLQVN
ncbi:hypothetical protein CDL12_26197 [Handroanthus impetiginosus]|uniref:Uncharacterized protein n=1 Tax=Handroanthus impetiginosus TaxID=429701 RepID=A0A2G9G7L8_9LAMI|nr:hypothetical protein CDL12_26197 [Handroanthus impetiginosus]